MKNCSLVGLGLVSSLICTAAVTADFQGLDYRIAATNAVEGDFNWTVEIYAVMDSTDRLDAVAGDTANTEKRLATTGTFFQSPYGGPLSSNVNPKFYPITPSLEYDSWVTIGAMDSTGYPYDENVIQSIGIDFDNFEAGGDLSTTNGTWYILPTDGQGEAREFTNQNCEDKYGVLVARVTTFDQNASVYLGALFQGKDLDFVTWSEAASIDITYPTMNDCNDNGVDDACDIINGTSYDDNGNGIPDECEFTDCNDNDVADEDDIANGTSEDCNENAVPDECETLSDCNGNGIPDECEDLADWNANGIADECEGLVAYNVSQDLSYYDWYQSATLAANEYDYIEIRGAASSSAGQLMAFGKPLTLNVRDGDFNSSHVDAPQGAIFGSSLNLDSLSSPYEGTTSLVFYTLDIDRLWIRPGAAVEAWNDTSGIDVRHVLLGRDSSFWGISSLNVGEADPFYGGLICDEGSAIFADVVISDLGEFVGTTDIYGDVTNDGTMYASDDILISQDLINNDLISINRGVLYVFENLENNGTILGEVDGGPGLRGGEGPSPGDGMRILGNYTAGQDATLYMQNSNWELSVGGNFDVAIDDSSRFDMSMATLAIINNGVADVQQIEVISTDMGATEDALTPSEGAFPIDTLRINSGSRIVELVDFNDNDGDSQKMSEVMYVRNLVVNSGATLNTNGYIIYTSELDNQGTIIGEDDIIIINPPTPGDINGDGLVNIADLLILIGDWGACPNGCGGDIDGDGFANIADLLIVIANWT